MKVGLLGYAGSGKTSVVSFLSGKRHESYDPLKPAVITVKISDSRLKAISEVVKPEKTTESEITFVDIKGCPESAGFDEKTIEIASQLDTIALVIRAFSEERNPCDELDSLYLEMVYRDEERLKILLEKRQQEILNGRRKRSQEEDFLQKCQSFLEQEKFLSSAVFEEKQRMFLVSLGIITIRKFFVVMNGDLMKETLDEKCRRYNLGLCQINAEGSPRQDIELFWKQFLEAAGMLRFYTIVGKETRAWLIPEGSTVLDAAAAIHTDIAAGFVRADVVSFDDFIAAGSFSACREKGLLRSEAKTGIVKDGDIIHIHSAR